MRRSAPLMRRWAALCLAAGVRARVRWIAIEVNPFAPPPDNKLGHPPLKKAGWAGLAL